MHVYLQFGYIHHHSAWWWWWFLDMRSGWFGEESLAASGFASNRALRQTSDSLLQTSKPGRSLFVLGVFFFVLSFTLLLRLLTRCIWFCLFVSWPLMWLVYPSNQLEATRRLASVGWWHLKRSKKQVSSSWWRRKRGKAGGRRSRLTPSLDNCCLKYLITGGYKPARGGESCLGMTDVSEMIEDNVATRHPIQK